jgi:hypothetical protein
VRRGWSREQETKRPSRHQGNEAERRGSSDRGTCRRGGVFGRSGLPLADPSVDRAYLREGERRPSFSYDCSRRSEQETVAFDGLRAFPISPGPAQ